MLYILDYMGDYNYLVEDVIIRKKEMAEKIKKQKNDDL